MDVRTELFGDDGTFPNSRLPLLVYPAAVEHASAEAMEALEIEALAKLGIADPYAVED